jgi:hypothetical protein
MNVPPTWMPTCIGWAVVSRESNDPSPPALPRRSDLRGEPPWHGRQRHLPGVAAQGLQKPTHRWEPGSGFGGCGGRACLVRDAAAGGAGTGGGKGAWQLRQRHLLGRFSAAET